jgi:hypothetical protein
MSTGTDLMKKFHWEPQPAAWKLLGELVAQFLAHNPFAARLARRMSDETGTRFIDWIDHLIAPETAVPGGLHKALVEAGYEKKKLKGGTGYVNTKGLFPIIGISTAKASKGSKPAGWSWLCAIKCESAIEFLQAHNLAHFDTVNDGMKDAGAGSRVRMSMGSSHTEGGVTSQLWAIERHGMAEFQYDQSPAAKRVKALYHLDRLRTRARDFGGDNKKAYAHTQKLVNQAVKDLGKDWACDLFFKAEREYWMRRNRAAQVQHARQQALGLGWANHDHHTYRCSRETFHLHVKLFESMGFHCRERFYAGHEAMWGAQVMEQPVTGITTFNDVDMSPDELMGNFASKGFKGSLPKLGTVGLWCELHGEAMFEAGMHHLECQFDHHALVKQLESAAGIKTMAPFTTFPYLRQAFTEGERWPVAEWRIEKLLKAGHINQKQASLFRAEGALGSHLENLERNDGFKGFNQQGVSDIIARTDARRIAESDAKVGA